VFEALGPQILNLYKAKGLFLVITCGNKLEMYSHPSGWELLADTSDLGRTNYLAKPHLS
jgi:hypothetical protein